MPPSLSDLKKHLNMSSTASDDELALMLDSAVEIVDSLVFAQLGTRAISETVAVRNGIAVLRGSPVDGTVTVNGATTGFTVDVEAGLIYGLPYWSYTATVAYSIGGNRSASLYLATLIIAAHLWETQRGTSPTALQGDDVGSVVPMGFAVPNRARELLEPFLRRPSVA